MNKRSGLAPLIIVLITTFAVLGVIGAGAGVYRVVSQLKKAKQAYEVGQPRKPAAEISRKTGAEPNGAQEEQTQKEMPVVEKGTPKTSAPPPNTTIQKTYLPEIERLQGIWQHYRTQVIPREPPQPSYEEGGSDSYISFKGDQSCVVVNVSSPTNCTESYRIFSVSGDTTIIHPYFPDVITYTNGEIEVTRARTTGSEKGGSEPFTYSELKNFYRRISTNPFD